MPRTLWLTDLGQNVELTSSDGDPPRMIGRYGVWASRNGRAECLDTSTDLEALKAKYGLPADAPVYLIGYRGVTGGYPAET